MVSYGVRKDTEVIDYDELEQTAEREAEGDHRRRQRLSAHFRFFAHAPDCRQGRRAAYRGHGPLCRTRCRRRTSIASAACAYRYQHDAQDAARTTVGADPFAAAVCCGDRQVCISGSQGGPLVHIMAASDAFRDTAACFKYAADRRQPCAETLQAEGFRVVSAHRHHCVVIFAKGMLGSEAEAPQRCRHYR